MQECPILSKPDTTYTKGYCLNGFHEMQHVKEGSDCLVSRDESICDGLYGRVNKIGRVRCQGCILEMLAIESSFGLRRHVRE